MQYPRDVFRHAQATDWTRVARSLFFRDPDQGLGIDNGQPIRAGRGRASRR